jgi:hypothetical protein
VLAHAIGDHVLERRQGQLMAPDLDQRSLKRGLRAGHTSKSPDVTVPPV